MDPNFPFLHHFMSQGHNEWYESLDMYRPLDQQLIETMRAITPPIWQVRRNGIWFYVNPPDLKLPKQGWKIHISATLMNCQEVLRRAASVCIRMGTPFKFMMDQHIVRRATSKGWPREASGKFMTIYPMSDKHFSEIIEILYDSMREFVGPFVLSDRRYKDSRVIYYRYGGFDEIKVLSSQGEQRNMIVSPSGDLFPDLRTPYWNPPPWVLDPFQSDEEGEDAESYLKDGRYSIESALGFSVTGGVYLAQDFETGSTVVVKEARPATGVDENGLDAVVLLQKEYRLLQKLQDTGIAPEPIDLFWDWEHLFLVEEYIPGLDLGHFTIGNNPIMRVYPSDKDIGEFVGKLVRIWTNLALSIAKMHDKGVVWGDLSIRNVIVRNLELGDVRIIDLEAAWEDGVDPPTGIATLGYSSATRRSAPSKEDDLYSLGAVMLGTLFPINGFLAVASSTKERFIEVLGDELGLPMAARQVIRTCMSDDASDRPTAYQVAKVIKQSLHHDKIMPVHDTWRMLSSEELLKVVSATADYICESIDLGREDRLFPADPMVFYTNPLSVAYGAAGVVYALSRITESVPKSILAWLLSHPVNPDHYPPGLYVGSAGIAWALWESGFEEVALQTMRATEDHPLLCDTADIFYGASGYGLASLRFYLGTGEQTWLDQAVRIGEWLLSSKVEEDGRGCYWPDKEGNVWLGYTRGSSGIALYLLYLGILTDQKGFVEIAERALAFDLSQVSAVEEGHFSMPRGTVGSSENVLTPYWLDGSAGVAGTIARFWAYTKNAQYLDDLERLAPDTFRRITAFPGLFRGLSGLGNSLLDAHDFTGDQRYLREAHRVANGVLLYTIDRPSGIAFPGEQLLRISTDFGTGSAGIALFLHRLARSGHQTEDTGQQTGDFNFTLDHLIRKRYDEVSD